MAESENHLALLQIPWADLDADRDPFQFPLIELVTGTELVAVVEMGAGSGSFQLCFHLGARLEDRRHLLFSPIDRYDDRLDRCQSRRQHETLFISVGHDESTDESGGDSP